MTEEKVKKKTNGVAEGAFLVAGHGEKSELDYDRRA